MSAGEAVADPAGTDPLAAEAPAGLGLVATPPPARCRAPARWAAARWAAELRPLFWPVAVYSGSRLLLLAVAGVVAAAGHHAFGSQFLLFDGQWYLRLAEHGYPNRPVHAHSTLGFLPLYPLLIRAAGWLLSISAPRAALVTSVTGGLAATILVQRLAAAWWGERAGRWATLVFCLFPGSIVFSMAYSECLTIPLAAGCLLALRSRHWWMAGILAGLATATEPVALVLIIVCVVAAGQQIIGRGWRDRVARRGLVAPLLACLGIGGFAIFLWARTGTPMAAYDAQHYGWHEQSQPLAFLALPLVRRLLSHPAELIPYLFTWNVWNGVLGGAFLAFSIIALLRIRGEVPAPALALTISVAALTVWSVMTPPNARMVLVAFPAIMVWGRLPSRRLTVFVAVEVLALVVTSALTLSGHMLP